MGIDKLRMSFKIYLFGIILFFVIFIFLGINNRFINIDTNSSIKENKNNEQAASISLFSIIIGTNK